MKDKIYINNPFKHFAVLIKIKNRDIKIIFDHVIDMSDDDARNYDEVKLEEFLCGLAFYENEEQEEYFRMICQSFFNHNSVINQVQHLKSDDLSALLTLRITEHKREKTRSIHTDVTCFDSFPELFQHTNNIIAKETYKSLISRIDMKKLINSY